MSNSNSRWCVHHETGWCAVKGGRRPVESETSVATRCNYFVILPGGTEHREPTCPECLADIRVPKSKRESEKKSKQLSFLDDLKVLMDKYGLAIVPTHSGDISLHDSMLIVEIDSQIRNFVMNETKFD